VIRFITLSVLLILALISYTIGFAKGALILVGIGVVLELGFWIGLFSSNKVEKSSMNT
jgi:hypothetical protein